MNAYPPIIRDVRPLLKWAGGKRQLLPALRRYYPAGFGRYIEPFIGSGAVFFDLYAAGRLEGRRVLLADVNPDLIGCYRAVCDRAEAVVAALADLEAEHRARRDACYYDVRDRRFNPERARLGMGFGALEHRRLQQTVVAAARRGVIVVLSNSSAPEIEAAYAAPEAQRAGLTVERVLARRAINSRAESRRPIDELIISNSRATVSRPPHLRMAQLADVRTARRTARSRPA